WNSFDVPLVSFTGVNKSNISQFKFVGSGGKNVLIDNLYFWDNSATVDAEAPTEFVATKGSVEANSVELLLNANDNTNVINYTVSYNTTTVNVAGVAGTQKTVLIEGLMASTAYTFTITAKDATGNMAANTLTVMATTTSVVVVPAAPTPAALAAEKVISIFSDAFVSSAGGLNVNPSWSQATLVSIVTLSGGNTALEYKNFNYQGTEFSKLDVSKLKFLHLDLYSANLPSVEVSIISPGQENFYNVTLSGGKWNSVDIALTNYTVPDLTEIFQLKIENKSVFGKTLLVDNIYFWTDFVSTVVGPPAKAKPSFPITFEDSSTVNYSISDFAGNTLSGIAADPDNANNKVLKSVRSPKVSGFEAYAGTVIAGKSFVNPIRFVAGKTKITARVYSPDANTLIALKVEGDGTPTESLALTTAVGWNNLTFDFGTAKTVAGMKSQVAQLDKNYTKLVIFYNFFVPGATQAVDKTYYVDDINTDAISTSVKSGNKNNEFSIYPNPSEGAFSVESTINATYEIVNTSGVLVKSGTLVVGVNSIASDLQSGIYVLRANGTVKKLVVR
ncbi:MAG: T9SS type A sorting domain-containing protein, partial [Cytophagales bacterium]